MNILRFTDGVEIDTSGDYRTLKRNDGWYVVGHGTLESCADKEEAIKVRDELIATSNKVSRDTATSPSASIQIRVAIMRAAVEALAEQKGKPVLDVLTALQGEAALLNDGEATLDLLCAVKSGILNEQLQPTAGPKFPAISVQLTGEDGNVFAILGRVRAALREGGVSAEDIKAFTEEVMASGSYDQALLTVMKWVDAS